MSSISSKFYKGSASGEVSEKETAPTSQEQQGKSMCQGKLFPRLHSMHSSPKIFDVDLAKQNSKYSKYWCVFGVEFTWNAPRAISQG